MSFPVTATVLPDAPTLIAVPHLLMIFESSETFETENFKVYVK